MSGRGFTRLQRVHSLSLKRLWYYFRLGHGSYMSLVIGLVQFLIIAYALFLQRFPIFSGVHFSEFAVSFSILYAVGSVIIGWAHRRVQMSTEADIAVVTNPYIFKITPGKEPGLFIPLQMFTLEMQRVLMVKLGVLTPKMEKEFDYWMQKLQAYMNGEEFR
jgi:hypothetical protein